ncbi:MAG TPA: winged helix-turn-helix domain-containing protein, partial [Pyrinomonadaceae bacterium]|nr:winged helix-turn-helix domain-containing protein [Pyrinomonadaceae bacterium]
MPHSNHLTYEFGPYRFNPGERVLKCADNTISLTPKAIDILLLLVTNAGQLVEKDELLKEVWPDTFVEESNLSQNIFILRRALGDERAGPKYIETVVRRGYRFVAPVRVVGGNGNHDNEMLAPVEVSQCPVVAVLPFINATTDLSVEYLADGVTDNIINNLSRVSKLRVMSRSAVLRYRLKEFDPQQIGIQLGATAVLVGKINSRPSGIAISVELVETATGWLLWGDSFDCESKGILEIQDAITRELLATLELPLTGDEEKRVTARYTENAEAYQAYLEGRYHWSKYTRKGIEKAIGHFRRAIDLDPNYALAYAGIVDCYLRLATNYLPPEDDVPRSESETPYKPEAGDESEQRIKLRFEWDWKGAERELRRANELKTDYPSPHQWYAAYRFSIEVFQKFLGKHEFSNDCLRHPQIEPAQLYSVTLSPNEEIQVFCTVAREQIEVGNYEAACLIFSKWWMPEEWPNLKDLDSRSAADLLFTTGSLAGCLSSTGRMQKGQKHAEALLSGSIGMFEYLGAKRRSAESKIELALCYYRQGMFELSRKTLLRVLDELHPRDNELRSLGLIRLGVVERHSGHVTDSLSRLSEAFNVIEQSGPLLTGRYHDEFAITIQNVAIAENRIDYLENVTSHFQRAFYEFVAIGHHRYAAVVQNNHGFLLLTLGRFSDAEVRLLNARQLFERLDDNIRRAQVEDTLARLYLATGRLDLAAAAADRAVASLELNDEEALLAEALTTKGMILCQLGRHSEAYGIL